MDLPGTLLGKSGQAIRILFGSKNAKLFVTKLVFFVSINNASYFLKKKLCATLKNNVWLRAGYEPWKLSLENRSVGSGW